MGIELHNVGQKKQVAYVYYETSYSNVFEIYTYAYMYIRERKERYKKYMEGINSTSEREEKERRNGTGREDRESNLTSCTFEVSVGQCVKI